MKSTITVLLICVCTGLFGQTTAELQKEIDATVWKPFQHAFETLDGAALNATYAKDVLRVTPGGIDTEEAFKKGNLERFASRRAEGVSIALDFWFDSRFTNASTSYEVGVFRITTTAKDQSINQAYGQFHIVIEKQNGAWKITQDWDTGTVNGKPIGVEDFEKGQPIRF